jgi:hypothetical protein
MKLNYTDFNRMTLKELCKISGVGKTTAARICSMRPFKEDNDLFKVRGLGKTTLKKVGVERKKKERKKWMKHPTQNDGVDYPHSCFATDSKTGQLDFFWRIPRARRLYYGHEEESRVLIQRLEFAKEEEPIAI